MKRRFFFAAGFATCFFSDAIAADVSQSKEAFDKLLDDAIADPAQLEGNRQDREGKSDEFAEIVSKGISPHFPPSNRRVSNRAIKLITAFEVTDSKRYIRSYRHPVWPKGASGVTIGIGYDVGYVTPEFLSQDWEGILTPSEISALQPACGHPEFAADMTPHLQSIAIEWPFAYQQFENRTLPRYTSQAIHVLPNARMLSDESLGAIVSLIYNRGASFKKEGPRYAEMRNIHLHMTNKEFSKIPNELKSMARIWQGNPHAKGLVFRRNLEALLFESGLKSTQL